LSIQVEWEDDTIWKEAEFETNTNINKVRRDGCHGNSKFQ
jgi:hypothetical protein